MGNSVYKYLFPFEKIPAGSRILLYGAGLMGQEYLKQLLITGYCQVIAFIDRRYAEYPSMVVPVYPPKKIRELIFDYIVIALRGGFDLPDILQTLTDMGIEKKRVVYVLERDATICLMNDGLDNSAKENQKFSYEYAHPAFALYLSGGFGDMVNHKCLLKELIRLVPIARIDIYAVHHIEFLEWLYSDCEAVDHIILDLGSYYYSKCGKYDLSISVFGSSFMQVDAFQASCFSKQFDFFIQKIEKLKVRCEDEGMTIKIPAAVAFYRRNFKKINCYSWLNYHDIFSIKDWHVSIPFLKKYEDRFLTLGLGRYITVNAGNGMCKNGDRVAKSWPHERFEEVIQKLRRKYCELSVVQIGAKEEEVLSGATHHFMGQEFGLVAYILRDALFHLDIEGGLVHLASQIGTKCIVLFGPTSVSYNAYPNNINIQEGSCHDCYGLYLDMGRCARGMQQPECMYRITTERVLQEVDRYLSHVPCY